MEIEHDDIVQVQVLAELFQEALDLLEADEDGGEYVDPDEVLDAQEVIRKLENFVSQNGVQVRTHEDALGFLEGHARYNASLIATDYMPTYAKDYAEDVNGIDTSRWPFNHIDWATAVPEFVRDVWEELDLDGQTYYTRDFQ